MIAIMLIDERTVRLVASCSAEPETVYDLLADLRSHVEWAGRRRRRDFRLLSLDTPLGGRRGHHVLQPGDHPYVKAAVG
jgi:hypothetical protein